MFKLVPIHIENESIYPNILGDYKPSQEIFSDYIIPHHIRINSLGLRGQEISVKKARGVYRILTLGDSYTYGARVSDEETFPFYLDLERLLNDTNQKKNKFEVINGGHSAYSTREEYEYFLERGIRLSPDIVILAWFPNDIQELSRDDSWRNLLKKHYKFEPWKSYARSSAIFNALRKRISDAFVKLRFAPYVSEEDINIFDNNDTPLEKKLWDRCFEYILKIKNTCDNYKIKFVLVILTDPEQNISLHGKFARFTEEHKIEFIDTTDRFLLSQKNDYYLLPKDPHFSAKGNDLVAEEIYSFLKERYL